MNKILYIGAGVSTQYGVLHLIKNGYDPKKITILDKGDDIYTRKPTEVMCGSGGCGTFSDFKVLQSWTQGGILTPEYLKQEEATKLGEQLTEYILEYHPDKSKVMYTNPADEPQWLKDSPFELKQASCIHLGTNYGRQQVRNIFEYFDKMGVKQYYNTEVLDIDFENKEVYAQCFLNERSNYGLNVYDYDKLVIAGGKSGVDLLDKIIKKYNIKTTPRPSQLGVRYETNLSYFEELAKIAYDFKLYKKWDNISGRSFCTNLNAAFVAPETTYGYITANGHAYKDPEKYNGLANFGILLEVKNEIDDPFSFKKDLAKFFNNEGKMSSYSPTNRQPSKTDSKEDMPCNSISLDKFKEGFGKYSDYILEFIEDLNTTFKINNDYIIYIPEVKYISNTLVFNKDFSLIDHPDVFVQGDNGVSRGIWIAGCTGLYLADNFLK